MPAVVFWLLLLFAPASSQFGLAERIGGCVFFTAFFVPLMAMRLWN